MKPPANALRWLDSFAACVRNRQFEKARELFADELRSFGTRAEVVDHLGALVEQQWSLIWNSTRDFRFLAGTATALTSEDGSLVCVMALWDSIGEDAEGRPYPRRGRCTILLQRETARPTGYLATHTHFSITPVGPDDAGDNRANCG